MSDTTNIDDLPTGEKGNITMEKQEKPVQPVQQQQYQAQPQSGSGSIQQQNQQFPQLSQDDINKIVSGIQTAGREATSLPVRDIPMNQTQLTSDPNVKPNYVPKQEPYIQNNMNQQTLYQQQRENTEKETQKNNLIDELHTPLIITILFFLFQLPFVHKKLYKLAPLLFLQDGNMSMNGYFFKSILFGSTYFILMKGIDYFSDM